MMENGRAPKSHQTNLFGTVGNAKGTCLDRDCRGASALSHAHSAQGAGPQRRAKTLTTSKNEFARRGIRGGLFHCDWPPMSLRPCRANSAPTMAIEKSPQRTPQRDPPKPPRTHWGTLGYLLGTVSEGGKFSGSALRVRTSPLGFYGSPWLGFPKKKCKHAFMKNCPFHEHCMREKHMHGRDNLPGRVQTETWETQKRKKLAL